MGHTCQVIHTFSYGNVVRQCPCRWKQSEMALFYSLTGLHRQPFATTGRRSYTLNVTHIGASSTHFTQFPSNRGKFSKTTEAVCPPAGSGIVLRGKGGQGSWQGTEFQDGHVRRCVNWAQTVWGSRMRRKPTQDRLIIWMSDVDMVPLASRSQHVCLKNYNLGMKL